MQLLTLFKAHICHSTNAALDLARKEVVHEKGNKHLDFASKLITAKNESAHLSLIKLATKSKHKYRVQCEKIEKYNNQEQFLEKLKFLNKLQYIRPDIIV
ncbi:hypothetical protein [Providencia alcalifaciens]|uniref:hypothetical protein n=1 Tax=Providencia alcalifaciens TaxID=126385 RepID=UPI00045311EC|nr:hypothetical protein [Providencia alcalifaciens]ETT04750.1 hypothetical protein HMPREF1562_3546 [Providencia alcalifaciens F90-2004]CAG9435619.1 hypothetical protein NVI2019_PLFLNFOB_03932 [Providencia alcalifaciens]CAG9435630.1 hypothetical protein NVI2019_ANGEOOBF_03933 [Providencia alcalifaciens]CAG9435631.1 hypothetical protein NVI2019_KOLGMIGM_03934 [Providencia alcalifaciens]CAG9436051.1 hypothetical protein NVI2019_OGMBKCAO_03997 [Providencia alcalifaciens]